MIGMIFFGKPSKYIKKLESTGKHIHEAPVLMYAPYVILAVLTLALGFAGPTFEVFLEGSLAHHLEHAVGMEIQEHTFSINRIAASTSIIAVLIGGGLSYLFYISNRMNPNTIINRVPGLFSLQKFFVNRWYINSLYYIIFVNGSLRLSKLTDKYIETGTLVKLNTFVPNYSILTSSLGGRFDRYVVDGTATRIANLNLFFSRNIRKLQTGITEQYVFVFTLGIVALIILLI